MMMKYTFDWKEYLNCIAMRKIQQFHIVDVLKNNVDGIEQGNEICDLQSFERRING